MRKEKINIVALLDTKPTNADDKVPRAIKICIAYCLPLRSDKLDYIRYPTDVPKIKKKNLNYFIINELFLNC